MAKTEERMFDCSECINTPYMSGMCSAKRQLLMKQSRHVTYEKNDILFEKDQPVNSVYILLSGKVKLTRFDEEGREQIIGIFSGGETIWEGVLVEGSTFPYEGIAMEETRVCIIEKSDFLQVLKEPEIALSMIRLLSEKLHDANERAYLMKIRNPKARLAAFLVYRQKHETENGVHLTLDDIAASLSLRPETVSRKIGELLDEGVIERTGKSSIRIVNLEKLEELVP